MALTRDLNEVYRSMHKNLLSYHYSMQYPFVCYGGSWVCSADFPLGELVRVYLSNCAVCVSDFRVYISNLSVHGSRVLDHRATANLHPVEGIVPR